MGRRSEPQFDALMSAIGGVVLLGLFCWRIGANTGSTWPFLLFISALVVGVVAVVIRSTESGNARPNNGYTLALIAPSPAQSHPYTSRHARPEREAITQQDLQHADWYQFEKLVARLYEARGNNVQMHGGANPDGGIDLVVERDGRRAAVQCKHWKAWKVGVKALREFLGAMTAEGFQQGLFVMLRDCTRQARDFAAQHHIKIVDGVALEEMLAQLRPDELREIRNLLDDPTKECPKCGAPMVLRDGSGFYAGKSFWGCSRFPRCRGKMKLAG